VISAKSVVFLKLIPLAKLLLPAVRWNLYLSIKLDFQELQ